MKNFLLPLVLFAALSNMAFAKIITVKDQFYIQTKQGDVPLMSVNELIKLKTISDIKIYGNGSAHLISYAAKDGKIKLYSVDEKGFVYAIEPFASYTVSHTEADGKFQFDQVPGRKYVVDAKGFFFH